MRVLLFNYLSRCAHLSEIYETRWFISSSAIARNFTVRVASATSHVSEGCNLEDRACDRELNCTIHQANTSIHIFYLYWEKRKYIEYALSLGGFRYSSPRDVIYLIGTNICAVGQEDTVQCSLSVPFRFVPFALIQKIYRLIISLTSIRDCWLLKFNLLKSFLHKNKRSITKGNEIYILDSRPENGKFYA